MDNNDQSNKPKIEDLDSENEESVSDEGIKNQNQPSNDKSTLQASNDKSKDQVSEEKTYFDLNIERCHYSLKKKTDRTFVLESNVKSKIEFKDLNELVENYISFIITTAQDFIENSRKVEK